MDAIHLKKWFMPATGGTMALTIFPEVYVRPNVASVNAMFAKAVEDFPSLNPEDVFVFEIGGRGEFAGITAIEFRADASAAACAAKGYLRVKAFNPIR